MVESNSIGKYTLGAGLLSALSGIEKLKCPLLGGCVSTTIMLNPTRNMTLVRLSSSRRVRYRRLDCIVYMLICAQGASRLWCIIIILPIAIERVQIIIKVITINDSHYSLNGVVGVLECSRWKLPIRS